MSVIVTGGAGFIGSCVVRHLMDKGVDDIVIVDNIDKTDKWKNLVNKRYTEYIHKNDLERELPRLTGRVSHVIHLGACSSTTEQNFDYLYKNNVQYSKMMYHFCVANNIPFIYASSAATYGMGEVGFNDDNYELAPLNGYGYSKHLFDLWVQKQEQAPPQCVGLKFFNVYGPNEYFKGSMASMVFHGYKQIRDSGSIKLFKSYKDGYEDGEQLRDFIYVKDICKVIWHFYQNSDVDGIFNVGTGAARSFNDLALSVFRALGRPSNIEYVEMPEILRGKYQYYTQADMDKLRNMGRYCDPFDTLEDGVADYVQNYLTEAFAIY